jgi:hypothetical protein
MFTRIIALVFITVLAGCQQSPITQLAPAKAKTIAPVEAVFRAAEAAPRGVKGVFELTVQATGEQDGFAYLNAELDYRDQRNLTIAIPPKPRRELKEIHSLDPKAFYYGKKIQVTGEAMRVRIDFYSNGMPSGKYYYQTHVTVYDPKQIEVVQ